MLAIVKILAGVLAVGTAIGVPTYLATKSSSSVENSVTIVKRADTKSPALPESNRQEKQFDDCLEESLTFRVKNKNDGREVKVVDAKEVSQYVGKPQYDVESLYSGQCKKDKDLLSPPLSQ